MRHWYFAAALLSISGAARAQNYELTLASYTAAALASSPEVRSAEDAYRAAEAAYKATWANMLLPTLSFAGTAYPWGDNPQNGYQFNAWRLNRRDMSFNTTLNLNVFNSFQDAQKARAAFAEREAALRAWNAQRQDRAFAAVQAYYDLDSKNEQLGVARQNLEGQEKQYRQSSDLYRHGMLSLADLLKSETDWRSSQLRLVSAEAEAKASLVELNSLIDRAGLEPVALRAELATGATTLPAIGPDLARALEQRPEVGRARNLLEASRVAYQQALQGILPAFQVNAVWNHTDTANFGAPVSASSLGIPNPNYYLGLSLSLPLGFNGVSQALAAAQARANRKAAQQGLLAAERTVRQEVAQAFVSLEKSAHAYALAQLKAEIAKRTLDLVVEQYSQGSADAIRMNEAQNDYLDARVSSTQALHDIFIDRARYARAVGDPLW